MFNIIYHIELHIFKGTGKVYVRKIIIRIQIGEKKREGRLPRAPGLLP